MLKKIFIFCILFLFLINLSSALPESVKLINADDAWSRGYTGKGNTICLIDSGVDYTHPFLGGCFGNGCKIVGGYDFVNNDNNPMDDYGHGTYVAGIIASSNGFNGVSPDAKILSLKVLNENGVSDEKRVVKALQWCYNNRYNYGGISAVVMSIGSFNGIGICTKNYANTEIYNLYSKNIPIFAAAGNSGNLEEISYPACNSQTISVGATYDKNLGSFSQCKIPFFDTCLDECTDETTYADKMLCNSNRGDNLDLLAPGCMILSTYSFPYEALESSP
jgi:subtilisin family serine protease